MFGIILLSVCTLMHIYVFWRAASVPAIQDHLSLRTYVAIALILWALFVLGRLVGHSGSTRVAAILEFLGMAWMATLFLLFVLMLTADAVTLFGYLMPRYAPWIRGGMAAAGILLSVAALIQGMRPPVITRYTVPLPGLPGSLDGTVVVALSDMHLGLQLGESWLAARIDQVMAEKPDMIVFLGDIFEGHGPSVEPLLTQFQRLSAPLGVWGVTGNHEFYGGMKTHLFDRAGITLLRDRWVEAAPGLTLAGVDDLTARRRRSGPPVRVDAILGNLPPDAAILLSHTPWQAESAAHAGVDLMLSGHTHGGQIWPFNYLVKRHYPLLAGRYEVEGMTAIVCRGTGTWGPRMRLWRPGEILRFTLIPGRDGP